MLLFLLGLPLAIPAHAQSWSDFARKQKIETPTANWHKLVLPDSVFRYLRQDLSDIRIYGITPKGDTLEAPYLLRRAGDRLEAVQVPFERLNEARNASGYVYTFRIPEGETVNQCVLDFGRENFDFRVRLEGSHDQQEWFTITENYRLVGIRNALTDYRFTRLRFPASNYRYLRLRVPAGRDPKLDQVSLSRYKRYEGSYTSFPVTKFHVRELTEEKTTRIDIKLAYPAAVSQIQLNVKDTFDYYRPLLIEWLGDSVKTEKGWQYYFEPLTQSTLTSLETPVFRFRSTIGQRFRLQIRNQDNAPLRVASGHALGYQHHLVARFTEPATYYLVYGNEAVPAPSYDIARFQASIPESLSTLALGKIERIAQQEAPKTKPVFENEIWLWGILIVLIALLGFFALRMLRQEEGETD